VNHEFFGRNKLNAYVERTTLLSYLKKEHILNEEMYDCLKYDLNKHLYYYGDHFKRPLEKVIREKRSEKIKNTLRELNAKNYSFQKIKNFDPSRPLIISNAYFTINDELSAIGYNTISPPWITSLKNNGLYDKSLITLSFKIRGLLEWADFNYLISPDFISLIEEFRNKFKNFLLTNKVAALVVPNDESFFENITIKICKELSIPTFIFLHGLPGVYNGVDGNRSDYLIVWGEKIKALFGKSGIDRKKIFISGHPYYKNMTAGNLRFSLDDIVVLTKALVWSPHNDSVALSDRGQVILYLKMIETVLRKLKVKKVRLRPHPSEDIKWYHRFVNSNFFEADILGLDDSLNNASLVIGPTSSVFLESMYRGVNYVVFEPLLNGKDMTSQFPVPPFDQSDNRVPVANDETSLQRILEHKLTVDTMILQEYIHPSFDVRFMKDLIK